MRPAPTLPLTLLALLLGVSPALAQDEAGDEAQDEAQDEAGAGQLAAPSPSGQEPGPTEPQPGPTPPPPSSGEVPPPPPGYGDPTGQPYGDRATQPGPGPVPVPAEMEPLWAERRELERELEEAQAEDSEHSLGMPIVLLAVGGGLALGAGSAFILYGEEIDRCFGDCDELETARIVAGVASVAGLGLAIMGIINLFNRLSDRAPVRERLQDLKRRQRELDEQLRPYGGPVAGGAVLGVRFAL